jgi:hypothetical protein
MIIKGDIAIQALKMAGIVDSLTAADPQEIEDTLFQLEIMAQAWEAKGLYTGYKIADDITAADPGDDSGITGVDVLAFVSNLSFNICPMMGRMTSPIVAAIAKETYANLFDITPPVYHQNPMQPTGAGDRGCCYGYTNNFMIPEPDTLTVEAATPIDVITL